MYVVVTAIAMGNYIASRAERMDTFGHRVDNRLELQSGRNAFECRHQYQHRNQHTKQVGQESRTK